MGSNKYSSSLPVRSLIHSLFFPPEEEEEEEEVVAEGGEGGATLGYWVERRGIRQECQQCTAETPYVWSQIVSPAGP